MSTVTGGPQIVRNGLILDLDASSANSYGPIKAEVLVVAGGGAGGGYHGGGGGAGGVLYTLNCTIVRNTTYTVTVGLGGAGANANSNTGDPGQNSIFSGASTVLTAVGGGAGKSQGNATAARNNGGSGGGGCDGNGSSITGGSGTTGQGFTGGDVSGEAGNLLVVYYGTAGGGGAGGVGGTGGIVNGGFGGPGLPFSISGTTQYYGGGGGGTNLTTVLTYGIGGIGGGGTGGVSPTPYNSPLRYSTNGSANTGGGGGGYLYSGLGGGSGGSGIVIIRYKGPQKATGGTITTVGTETVHTFTSSGTFVTGTNFIDLSGNNNNGTINGAIFNSANGGSIVFDGLDDYISITNNSTLRPTSELTIEYIIKGTTPSGWCPIIGYGNGDYTNGNYLCWVETGGALQSLCRINNGGVIEYRQYSGIGISTTTLKYMSFTMRIGDSIKSYYNGVNTNTPTNLPAGGSFYYGGTSSPYQIVGLGGAWLNGSILFFRLYNRALTAAEVSQNYEATKTRFGL